MKRTDSHRPKSTVTFNGEAPAMDVRGINKQAKELKNKFRATASPWRRSKDKRKFK